jgi:hypothetical protein
MNEKYELFKWYRESQSKRRQLFFIFKQRPHWEHDLIRYDPEADAWVKENLGFIYGEETKEKIDIPEKSLRRLIKGLFVWTWSLKS